MFIKECEYTDFLGKVRKEKFYFNLTKAEITEWLATEGDYTLDQVLEKMMSESNMKELVGFFKDLICKSYGEPSLDGRRFMKSEEILQNFVETEAYSDLFMEIAGNGKKAAEFIRGILPKDLDEEIEKIIRENPEGIPDDLKEYAAVFARPMIENQTTPSKLEVVENAYGNSPVHRPFMG